MQRGFGSILKAKISEKREGKKDDKSINLRKNKFFLQKLKKSVAKIVRLMQRFF